MPLFQAAAKRVTRWFARSPAPLYDPQRDRASVRDEEAYVTRQVGGGRSVIPTLPSAPDKFEYSDLIVSQVEAWSAALGRSALSQHDQGLFSLSAQLADFMLRDDRVMSALNTRVLGLTGLPFEIAPAVRDDASAQEVADALKEDWGWIAPSAVVEELLQWEALMGFALAEVVWDTSGDRWIPTLKVWHPQYVYYRLDLRRYIAITEQGTVAIEPGNGKWLLFSRHGHYRAWIRGALRALLIPWLLRSFAWRDWGRYNEAQGLPVKGARVPASGSNSDKVRFFQQVRDLESNGTLLLPEDAEGRNKFDLEYIATPNVQGWEAFKQLLLRADSAINLLLLGQNLSGGDEAGGSHAKAKVADGVRDDYKQADAVSLAEDLYAQVVRPWCVYNFGDEALTPRPTWDGKPREDQAQTASTFDTLMDALGKLAKLVDPSDVDMAALVKRFTLPVKPTATLQKPPEPAPPGAGKPPGPPGNDTTQEAA